MRRFLRTSLPIIASLSVLGVLLKVSGVWQRFLDRQFEEREFRPTGRFARIYAQTAPWLGWWTYGDFAGRLALQSEDDVLDVACGSGAFLRKHASHARRIAGLDHSQALIEIALRENSERVAAGIAEFVVGDATALPWADDQFSAVTSNCVGCFEQKAERALAEMYRVLRPGGRVVVADDRREMMEAIGFTRVSAERLLWGLGYVTTGFKG